jgi:hypothetical protein
MIQKSWLLLFPPLSRRHASTAATVRLKNAKKKTKSVKNMLMEAKKSGRGHLHYALSERVFDFQKNENNLFVGLDVSSRCTGIAVVDASGKGVAYHACETHRLCDVIEVGRTIRTDFKKLLSEVEIEFKSESLSTIQWHAGVEACAKNFTRGRFNAKGLVKLAQINGISQYICAEQLGTVPLLVNPSTARTFFDLRTPPPPTTKAPPTPTTKGGGGARGAVEEKQPVKERVYDFVQRRDTMWIPDLTSKSRLDISDAFLIAWYTRVNQIFHMLANDHMLWSEFEICLLNIKPVSAKREAIDVFHKYLWEWLREHKDFLSL